MSKILPAFDQIVDFLKDHPWIKSVPSLMRRFQYSYEYDQQHRLLFETALKKFKHSNQKKDKHKSFSKFSRDRQFSDRHALKTKSALLAVEIQAYDAEGNFIAQKMPSLVAESGGSSGSFLIHRHQDPLLKIGDQLIVRTKPKGLEIVRKLGKSSKVTVGVVDFVNNKMTVTPCNRRDKRQWVLAETGALSVQDGDIVVCDTAQPDAPTVTKVLGSKNDPKVFPWIALYTHGISTEFSELQIQDAQDDKSVGLEDNRQDLRHLNFVTIDGEDAKDFDDAVWAEPESNGWHFIVAIADVSWYVSPNSALDIEARNRGNSVYLPGMVIPMLPEHLSNGVCSLKPHEDRACLAAHLWIDSKGNLTQYRFESILIQSKQRLTYTQAQEIHDTATPHPLKTEIGHLYGAFHALITARSERGALDLEMPEYRVSLAPQGNVQSIADKPRYDSHRLIEEMMICANVAAAKFLQKHHFLCMYRIHESPDIAKVSVLFDFLKQRLGVKTELKGPTIVPHDFKKILKKVEKTPHQEMINELVLRCQSQARYSPENQGHFGLNLADYAHFTSPIRRYADLLVHRAIRAVLEKKPFPYDKPSMLQIGSEISLCERRAVMAERDTLERYVCLYLEQDPNTVFQARVSSIARFGVFVVLLNLGATAIVPLEALKGRALRYNEKKQALSGKTHSYHLGDQLTVKITNIDPISASITATMV